MLRAYKFGYAGAREVLLNKYGFDAAPLLLRPHAKALHGTARVVSNCINQYTKTVLQSAPDTLRKEADDALKKKEAAEKWVYCAPGKKALQDSVDFSQETRYLLFDDDQEKNFHDLLCLLDRIAAVERNIIRVAVYELNYCPDIPALVSIDEAIEIAKAFASEKSGVFINGILNGVKDALPPDAKQRPGS